MKRLRCLILLCVLLSSSAVFAESLELPQLQRVGGALSDDQELALKEYTKKLDRVIRRHWFPPHDGRAPTIRFTIKQAGNLGASKVIQTSGDDRSDRAAIEALQKASPFPRPPERIGELAVICKFDYSQLLSGPPHFRR